MSDLNIPVIAARSSQKCNDVHVFDSAEQRSPALVLVPAPLAHDRRGGSTVGKVKGPDGWHDGETHRVPRCETSPISRKSCDQGSVANLSNHFHYPTPGAGHRAEMASFLHRPATAVIAYDLS